MTFPYRAWVPHNKLSIKLSWGMGVSGFFIRFVDPVEFDEGAG